MNIITGLPRSGTSLGSLIIKNSGCDYITGGLMAPKADPKIFASLNPTGYWESTFTNHGFHPSKSDDKHPDSWTKIINRGLALSDHRYIGKMIYMARHPMTQANSMRDMAIKLGRGDVTRDQGAFIASTGAVAQWLILNKKEFPLVVGYDSLINNTESEILRISEYTGLELDGSVIDPALRRSEPVDHSEDLWIDAIKAYEWILEGRWDKVYSNYVDFHIGKSRRARSVQKLAKGIAKGVARGDKLLADAKTIVERTGVCLACPKYLNGKCELCTCPISRKVRLATEECPLEKW